MEIHDIPTMPASPGLASIEAGAQNELLDGAQQSQAITVAQIVLTTDISSPLSPLGTHEEAAAKEGVVDSANPQSSPLPSTILAGDMDSKDAITHGDPAVVERTESEDPFIGLESPAAKDTTLEVSASHNLPCHEHGAEEDDRFIDNGFMDLGSPRAESIVSESGTHLAPDSDPVSSSVKGQRSKRLTKATINPDDLPDPDSELTDAEIASLFSQPPKIRQRYPRYFSGSSGHVRAAHQNLLFERLPDGELRFSEDIFRSCLLKWKDRLEAFEAGESHTSVGARKRKSTVIPAKRGADDNGDAQKMKKKATASKDTKLPVGQQASESGPATALPTIRIRPLGSRRETLSGSHSTSQAQYMQGESVDGRNVDDNLSGPSMDNRQPVPVRHATQPQHSGIIGSSQLLDPVHRSGFIQFLTSEIHQLDYVILNTVRSHHYDHIYQLRRLWHALAQLRDMCVDLDVEQKRRGKTTQDQDETDKQ